ncbi:DUF998 domain-containing protein [Plantactinospora sp. B6F1]|uniref:DUF998 domain-containing protein n=1 Tax=Plantactinospora sp. B6F1 TaxID=3158971 RepID=UPI00102C4A35
MTRREVEVPHREVEVTRRDVEVPRRKVEVTRRQGAVTRGEGAVTRREVGGVRRPAVALAAATCTLLGTVAVAVAVAAGPASELAAYVSEAGASGSTTLWPYRVGLLATAAGLVLLGAALPAALRLAAGLLVASAVATVVSAGVSCRSACPLPPFDQVTLADLVHGGASVAAVAGTVFAMLAVAGTTGAARPLRRISAIAAAVALPLSAVAGLAMLLVGRSVLMGAVERLLLLDLAGWAVATALTMALTRPPATLVVSTPTIPNLTDGAADRERDGPPMGSLSR